MNKKGEIIGISAAATLILAGCAPADIQQEPAPVTSITAEAPVGPIGPEAPITSGDTMDVQYINLDGVIPELSTIQAEIGDASIEAALLEPFTIVVDGETQTVHLSVPKGDTEQTQAVVFIPNSQDAGAVFAEYGLTDHAGYTTNTTVYSMEYGPNGELVRQGPSMSVVGQETENAGPFRAIATERCQPLEMISETKPIIDVSVYSGMKEAVCNTLGYAADSIMLHGTYNKYVQEHGGNILGEDVNNGHVIKYPVLSQAQYDHLAMKLTELGLN